MSLREEFKEFSGESQRLLSQNQVANKRRVGFSLPLPPDEGEADPYALSQDVMSPFPPLSPRKKTHTHPPSEKWPLGHRNQRRALDLFSGSGGVGAQIQQWDFKVWSLDIDPKPCPTICVDIMDWDYVSEFPPHFFHLIAAGPPCTEYSIAKTIGERNLAKADTLVQKALEIIEYFQPKIWWIENPRTGLLKTREIVAGLHFIDVDYCQFCDWGYKKPTRLWVSESLAHVPDCKCNKKNLQKCCGFRGQTPAPPV